MFLPRQIRRKGDRVRLNLDAHEQALLRELLDQLEPQLADPDDPSMRRLFPPAYSDEREATTSTARSSATSSFAGAPGRSRRCATRSRNEEIDLEQADEWLRALNDLRLVLGTRLDVSEELDYESIDLDTPRGRDLAVYGYLAWLQEQLVEALQPASGR